MTGTVQQHSSCINIWHTCNNNNNFLPLTAFAIDNIQAASDEVKSAFMCNVVGRKFICCCSECRSLTKLASSVTIKSAIRNTDMNVLCCITLHHAVIKFSFLKGYPQQFCFFFLSSTWLNYHARNIMHLFMYIVCIQVISLSLSFSLCIHKTQFFLMEIFLSALLQTC